MVDLGNNLGRSFSVTTRHMIAFMARRMESLGIGAGQYMYLFSLYREDGQTQQSLSDRLLVDKSATVGAMNRLEALGYVERRPDPTDRRHHRIFLTELGRAIRPELEAVVAEVQEVLLDGFSPAEREALQQLMHRVMVNISTRT